MASVASFPSVDTGAMSACATGLKSVADQMSDTGVDVSALQQAVSGSEDWKGEAASRWQTVVTGRVSDANLTDEVLGKAASLLDQIAADLEAEQNYYNKVSAQMQDEGDSYNPRFNPAPPDWEASYVSALNASVARATSLLQDVGSDFLALAALADDIGAETAPDRTPGVPQGASRKAASQNLLVFLMGTVLGNQKAGAQYEQDVLSELGLTKNTSTFRPGTAFEGRTTASGLPKGTTPDAMEDGPDGYIVEIKGYNGSSVTARFQIRLEEYYAQATGQPMWVVAPKGAEVSDSVIARAEGTGGGVLYRVGPNQYEDPNGNPVQVGSGMKVSGYQPTTGVPSSASGGTSDPGAPSTPVSPSSTGPAPGPADPVGPDDPVDPGDPDPIIDIP